YRWTTLDQLEARTPALAAHGEPRARPAAAAGARPGGVSDAGFAAPRGSGARVGAATSRPPSAGARSPPSSGSTSSEQRPRRPRPAAPARGCPGDAPGDGGQSAANDPVTSSPAGS